VDWDYLHYYDYRPLFRDCWGFMTLLKFQVGRIHQIRAYKAIITHIQTGQTEKERSHAAAVGLNWKP